MTKKALAIVFASLFALSMAKIPTVNAIFSDIFEFDKGFISGFVNKDISHSAECTSIIDKAKKEVDIVWADFRQMKNQTLRDEAFRDILHVVQKLPKEFKGCGEISGLIEELARKSIILFDP